MGGEDRGSWVVLTGEGYKGGIRRLRAKLLFTTIFFMDEDGFQDFQEKSSY